MTSNPLAPEWLSPPVDANALAPAVWPAHADRGEAGALRIAGVSAVALAEEFGTPLYVFDEQDARTRAAHVRAAFTAAFAPLGADVHVYYAGKAFLSTEIARWMTEAGLRIDVASGGELAVALAAGTDPSELGFHGNNKSIAEIEEQREMRTIDKSFYL